MDELKALAFIAATAVMLVVALLVGRGMRRGRWLRLR